MCAPHLFCRSSSFSFFFLLFIDLKFVLFWINCISSESIEVIVPREKRAMDPTITHEFESKIRKNSIRAVF